MSITIIISILAAKQNELPPSVQKVDGREKNAIKSW